MQTPDNFANQQNCLANTQLTLANIQLTLANYKVFNAKYQLLLANNQIVIANISPGLAKHLHVSTKSKTRFAKYNRQVQSEAICPLL